MMDSVFKQEKFEVELLYLQKVFSVNRVFKSGKSFEKNKILFAENSHKNSKSVRFLEREKYIRNCIENAFNHSHVNINIRLYYKYFHEDIFIGDKKDSRKYEYFRIIYQSENGDLIFEEKNIENENNVYELIIHALGIVDSKVKTILDKKSVQNEITGNFDIVLPSSISGFYIHELIGHMLEDDFYYHPATVVNENTRCSKLLNVSDLALINNNLYTYDDLGNCCDDIQLIENGEIINCISESSGNKRRQSFTFPSLTRMRTTYIHPLSKCNAADYISKLCDGIFIEKVSGGNVNPLDGNYVLTGYGMKITNGKKTNFISKLKIEGNIIGDLMKIKDVGDDLEHQGIECFKKNQFVRVGVLSPSMLLENIKISGVIYE